MKIDPFIDPALLRRINPADPVHVISVQAGVRLLAMVFGNQWYPQDAVATSAGWVLRE